MMKILKFYGDRKSASMKFADGRIENVYRIDKIFVREYGKFVRVLPYSMHFIFEVKKPSVGESYYNCTCGSMAVVTGFGQFEKLDSSQEANFVCFNHATYGKHADGSTE